MGQLVIENESTRSGSSAAAAQDAAVGPIFEEMRGASLREIARTLTERQIEAPRGGTVWNQVTVMRAMKRLGIASATA